MMGAESNAEAKTVAFFDFDGTLTTGDTLMPFLKFVVGAPSYYAKLGLVSPVLIAYLAKLIRNDIAKRIVLKQYLAGYHIEELYELGECFSEEVIPTMLRPEGMERLRWHQNCGHECVLMSASLDVYLSCFASENNFNKLICSSLKINSEGKVDGSLEGDNCSGDIKVEFLKEYLRKRGGGYSYAYGNSLEDLGHLTIVDEGWLLESDTFKRC